LNPISSGTGSIGFDIILSCYIGLR
jgi:hypothetical protein